MTAWRSAQGPEGQGKRAHERAQEWAQEQGRGAHVSRPRQYPKGRNAPCHVGGRRSLIPERELDMAGGLAEEVESRPAHHQKLQKGHHPPILSELFKFEKPQRGA